VCNGAGLVHPLLDSGKPDFTRVVACRCAQKTVDGERRERLEQYGNLGSLRRHTFDKMDDQGRSGNAISQERFAHAYQAARDFAGNPDGWLVLLGPSGSGKTHLAAAIANERLNQGYPVLYKSAPDLLDDLRETFLPDKEIHYNQSFDQVRNAPLLILDDLGTQSSTPWAREKLDQLLNYRFNQALPTVIVTSISMAKLDERIRTRFSDPELCQVYLLEESQFDMDFDWPSGLVLQRSMTFARFDWRRINLASEQQRNLEQAYRLALDFAKLPEGWLVFMGVTGCGKTHLAAAIVNYRYQAKKPALFVVVPEFLDHLRSTFNPESKVSYDQLFERVNTRPLLVLDDFGEQTTTPWVREKLYQVITHRYNAKLPTVFTTRCSLEEILEDMDSAISSRLVDHQFSTPFNITAPDYRGDISSARGAKKSGRGRRRRYVRG
jgi:DNA replication protein DnaC